MAEGTNTGAGRYAGVSFGVVGRHQHFQKAASSRLSPYDEIGRTGLRQWGGYVIEEWLSELQGRRGAEMYREMADQDPIIGAILFACEMLARRVDWWGEPASTNGPDIEANDFAQEVLFEGLEDSWSDTISEILSMLTYGYHLGEVVYMRRQDGRIGIRKIATRAQDSLLHWEFDDHDEWQAFVQSPPPSYTTYRIPREKALLFRTKVHKGNPEGRSILRNSVRPYYFLKNLQNLEGIGVERDLAGLPMLTPPDEVNIWDTQEPQMVTLLQQAQAFVAQVRRDEMEGVVVPAGWKFELLQGAGKRQLDTNAIITRYEQRIATSVLADFVMLGQEAVGSYALAGTKKDLFSAALEAFLDQIAAVFNTYCIPRLFKLNGFQGLTDYPKLCHGPVDDLPLETIAAVITAMSGAGAPLFTGDESDPLRGALLERLGLPSETADDTSAGE